MDDAMGMVGDAGAQGQTFTIEHEDHTLANSLRFFLNKNPHVTFCGYSMPHPTEDKVNIRVQTADAAPSAALLTACQNLKQVCEHIDTTFDRAVAEFKARPLQRR